MSSAVEAEDLNNGALQPEHTSKQEAGAVKQEPLTATEEDSKPVLAKAEPDVSVKAELKAEPLGEVKEEADGKTEEPGAQPSDEQLAARLQALLQRADMSVVTGEPVPPDQRVDVNQALQKQAMNSNEGATSRHSTGIAERAEGKASLLLVTPAAVQAGLTHSLLCTSSVGEHAGPPCPRSTGPSSACFAWLQLTS